jgi:hypothetical protein
LSSSTEARESADASTVAARASLPPVTGLSSTVGSDRRLVLRWNLDPAYATYEIHESTVDPINTLKATQATSPRTSNPLTARPTPLRYGVRGRTADGTLGPFGNAVEVLIRSSGATVTVTDRTFELAGGGGGQTPGRPDFPGDLIPMTWKLTTTLGEIEGKPMEVWPDGRESNGENPGKLRTYVNSDHWRLTDEQGRWGIRVTCPADGNTTPNSENTRWELRGLNSAGTGNEEFDLVDDAPILDTEVCVLGLEGNHAVLSQIHGQEPPGNNDDLTVWRAEPNEDDPDTYTLWITKMDEPHGHPVDRAVRYGEVIHIGFRPEDDRVRYVYNGQLLDYKMDADFSTRNFGPDCTCRSRPVSRARAGSSCTRRRSPGGEPPVISGRPRRKRRCAPPRSPRRPPAACSARRGHCRSVAPRRG